MNPLLPFFAAQGFGETEAEAIAGAFALKALEKGSFFVEEGKTSGRTLQGPRFRVWASRNH
ncbi:MAG: hypothetical protein IPH16_02085 [Haliscomenobacter sp.]|nr:hypothetical protein [Haliscomenobacter sp.]MBK7475431.1 hypothetical protein [Haliscomenobacter sp.]MBK8878015.1 hypothetical protein [Haliscomenobacter sp.]